MLRAGAARIDITPPVGVDLQGYAGRTKGAQGILEPLLARCVVVEHPDGRWVLISADVISFETPAYDELRARIGALLGTAATLVSVATTHTHSGPALLRLRNFGEIDPVYAEYLTHALARSALDAMRKLQPVVAANAAESGKALQDLRWAERRLELDLAELPPRSELARQLAEFRKRIAELSDPKSSEGRPWYALAEWAQGCLEESDGGAVAPHRTTAVLQGVRLGETAFAFIPGELFVELGRSIKSQSPITPTHVVGYANGWVGYLPTRAAVAAGGYEPTAYRYWQSRSLADESGERIAAAAADLLRGLA